MRGYIFSDCQNISDVRGVIESKSKYLLAFDTNQLKYHFVLIYDNCPHYLIFYH